MILIQAFRRKETIRGKCITSVEESNEESQLLRLLGWQGQLHTDPGVSLKKCCHVASYPVIATMLTEGLQGIRHCNGHLTDHLV